MSLSVFPGNLFGMAFPIDKESTFANLAQSAPSGLEVVVLQTRNPLWKWTLIYELLKDDPTQAAELINGYTEYETVHGFQLAMTGSGGVFLLEDPKDNYVGPGITGSSTPNLAAELQLVDDGAGTYYSPVQRNFGGQFYEDVTDINGTLEVYANGTLKALTTDYTLVGPGLAIPGYSFMGMVVKWNAAAGAWAASHAYSVGDEVLDAAGHIQKVTTAGTSGSGSAPTWNDGGSTTPDGTGSLVWTDQGYNPGPTGPITTDFHFYFRVKFAEDTQGFSRFDDVRWTIGGENAGDSTNMILKSARPDPA
jgi:hypothetical protein